MRMAIVDDVLAEQEIIKKYIIEWASIHNEMIEFRCFENSDSFLFSWEDDKSYDLLVLDIEMGEMNGLELAKRMSKYFRGLCDRCIYTLSTRHICHNICNMSILFQFFGWIGIHVADNDVCTIRQQFFGNGQANTRCTTGHDNNFSFQIQPRCIHFPYSFI